MIGCGGSGISGVEVGERIIESPLESVEGRWLKPLQRPSSSAHQDGCSGLKV